VDGTNYHNLIMDKEELRGFVALQLDVEDI
jgi:hypothetical protein